MHSQAGSPGAQPSSVLGAQQKAVNPIHTSDHSLTQYNGLSPVPTSEDRPHFPQMRTTRVLNGFPFHGAYPDEYTQT